MCVEFDAKYLGQCCLKRRHQAGLNEAAPGATLASGRKLIAGFQPGWLIPSDAGDLRGLDVPNRVSGPSPAEASGTETATCRAVFAGSARRARAGLLQPRGRWIRRMLSGVVFMSSCGDGEGRVSG